MFEIRKYMPLILLALGAVLVFSMCGSYNNAVGKDENVKKLWSDVETQYQRRMDLIPNLERAVSAQADFEQSTLKAVVEARASATQVKVDPNNLTPEAIEKFERAQGAISSTLGRLLAVSENYPQLRAHEGFLKFQDEYAGTENRIAVARKTFNAGVQEFNAFIRRFPTNLLTGIFGFSPKGYFQSASGAEKAPEAFKKQ
jgi:LemA protein